MTEGYCCLTELSLERQCSSQHPFSCLNVELFLSDLPTIVEDESEIDNIIKCTSIEMRQRDFDRRPATGPVPIIGSYRTSDASYSGSPSPQISASTLSTITTTTPDAWQSVDYRSPLGGFPSQWDTDSTTTAHLPGHSITAYPDQHHNLYAASSGPPTAIATPGLSFQHQQQHHQQQLSFNALHQVHSMPQLAGALGFSTSHHASPAASYGDYSSLDSESSLAAHEIKDEDCSDSWNTIPHHHSGSGSDYPPLPDLTHAHTMVDDGSHHQHQQPRPSFASNPALSPDLRIPNRQARRPRAQSTASSERVIACEVCGKTFNRTYNCKVHMQTHKGDLREKPYICKEPGCGRRCSRQTDLKRHTNSVHEKKREHRCSMCDKPFARKDTLKRHEEDGCRERRSIRKTEERRVRSSSLRHGLALLSPLLRSDQQQLDGAPPPPLPPPTHLPQGFTGFHSPSLQSTGGDGSYDSSFGTLEGASEEQGDERMEGMGMGLETPRQRQQHQGFEQQQQQRQHDFQNQQRPRRGVVKTEALPQPWHVLPSQRPRS